MTCETINDGMTYVIGCDHLGSAMPLFVASLSQSGRAATASVIARDRPLLRRLALGQVEHDLVDIAPTPTFRRIIALDHGMTGGVEMRSRMLVRRIVAA